MKMTRKLQDALDLIQNAVAKTADTDANKVFTLDFNESVELENGFLVTRVSRGFIYERSGMATFIPYGTGFDPSQQDD